VGYVTELALRWCDAIFMRESDCIEVGGSTGAMPGHDIAVIGFSAGGVEPLFQLVVDLHPDFPASRFVVHRSVSPSVSPVPGTRNQLSARARCR
jgi:hypothetical protein